MPAKLYEFSLVDKYNTPESDILRTVEQSLAAEAELQEWEPGYTYQQLAAPRKSTSDVTEYQFTVFGHFKSDIGSGFDSPTKESTNTADPAAAKQVDL